MKSLSLLNDDTTIKLGDTGTMVQFTATNNEAPVQLTENQTAQFRLKNDFGLVKTINATTTYNGLIFQFDTADLKGLVQGKYQVELAVNVDKDNTLIFPDDGFVSFTLSANALNIVGQQLNLISLDDFKEQANQYIQQQTQDLESNFDNYVAKIKQGPQGEQGPTGPAGGFGDYVTGTGWLDLSPFMNTQVWCGWDPDNTPSDIGYNKYAVTSINGQNIFWFRIHSRFKDASIANNWGTKLFDIPADVQKQYGNMEQSQYQGGIYECNGQPCLAQIVGNAGSRYVQTRGALQMQNNNDTFSGTTTVNYEGWFIL